MKNYFTFFVLLTKKIKVYKNWYMKYEKLYKVANIDDYNKTSNRALIFYQYSGGSYE